MRPAARPDCVRRGWARLARRPGAPERTGSDARERGAHRPTRSSVVQARQPFHRPVRDESPESHANGHAFGGCSGGTAPADSHLQCRFPRQPTSPRATRWPPKRVPTRVSGSSSARSRRRRRRADRRCAARSCWASRSRTCARSRSARWRLATPAGSNPSRATSAPRNAQARSPGSPTSPSSSSAPPRSSSRRSRGDGDRVAAAGRRDAAVPHRPRGPPASWSLAGFVGIGSVLAAEIVPVSNQIPAHFLSALGLITLMIAFGLLLVVMLEVSRRMKSTAEDLRSVVAMSGDLARDARPPARRRPDRRPHRPGRRRRRLRAELLGPARRPGRHARLLPARAARARSSATYPLDDYPETRRVLDERPLDRSSTSPTPAPTATRSRYLRSIGQRSHGDGAARRGRPRRSGCRADLGAERRVRRPRRRARDDARRARPRWPSRTPASTTRSATRRCTTG